MGNPVGLMNNAVDSAFRNRLASAEDGFVSRHALGADSTKKRVRVFPLVVFSFLIVPNQ